MCMFPLSRPCGMSWLTSSPSTSEERSRNPAPAFSIFPLKYVLYSPISSSRLGQTATGGRASCASLENITTSSEWGMDTGEWDLDLGLAPGVGSWAFALRDEDSTGGRRPRHRGTVTADLFGFEIGSSALHRAPLFPPVSRRGFDQGPPCAECNPCRRLDASMHQRHSLQ